MTKLAELITTPFKSVNLWWKYHNKKALFF